MTIDAPGDGALAVARGHAGSVVTRAVAKSPLQLLVPRNHGDAVWAYLSSHGGGLVDGDRTALAIEIGAGARALLATQASTKVYRSPRGCVQRIHAEVGAGGLLVLMPDPIVCFAGARLAQSIDVRLAEGASLLVVDAFTAGRAARGERWQFDGYASAITVHRGDRLLLHDAIDLDPDDGALAERMGRFDGLATIAAFGVALAPPPPPDRDWIASRSPIAEGELVRAAATSAERLHAGIRAALIGLPALLGDDPFARKY